MNEPTAFKSGRDLGNGPVVDEETLCCVGCGAAELPDKAYEAGWQIEPAACPDCLRWTLTLVGECCCGELRTGDAEGHAGEG
jgi:hypothetical protein